MMRIKQSAAVLLLLLAAGSTGLEAQDGQWRITPFVVAGGFPTDLIGARTSPPSFVAPFEIGRVRDTVVVEDGYGLDSFTGFGGAVMYRKNRIGVEAAVTVMPTNAAAVGVAEMDDATEASGLGFRDELLVFGKIQETQNLLATTLGVTFFTETWQPGRPPPAYELFFSAAGGLVTYLNDELLEGWASGDSSFLMVLGAGGSLNFTPNLSVRVEVKDHIFSTDVRDESTMQHAVVFSPGITIMR